MASPVALITGGQRGIGLGVARALADAGFRLAISAERAAADPEVATALAALGPCARYYRHDVGGDVAPETLLEAVAADMGEVDCLVSNAGVAPETRRDLLDVTPDSFDRVLGVNLRGGFFLAQAVARRMLARPPGGAYRCILFVTSVSAELASVERGEYCVSKAGAAMVAKLFALRLAEAGVGVFELRPGVVRTAMTAAAQARHDARIAGGLVPAGRWGEPEDVGSVAAALATGSMAFCTGAAIPVDGGLSVGRL